MKLMVIITVFKMSAIMLFILLLGVCTLGIDLVVYAFTSTR